jgi:hypothetical protein
MKAAATACEEVKQCGCSYQCRRTDTCEASKVVPLLCVLRCSCGFSRELTMRQSFMVPYTERNLCHQTSQSQLLKQTRRLCT